MDSKTEIPAWHDDSAVALADDASDVARGRDVPSGAVADDLSASETLTAGSSAAETDERQADAGPAWPKDPYKGLANYEFEDQRLFAGRDAEIDACAELLANSQTKLLILHGQTGCGKSSFLRAGLIPALEENGDGYLFLKRQSTMFPECTEPSFIRCGADPLSRIAEELFLFTAQPLTVKTATGPRLVDFTTARLKTESLAEFLKKCTDPHQLYLALEALTKAVPHTLVLILDQAEEVFTLESENEVNRERFSDFIKEVASSNIDMRFLFAIRKDYSGQLIDLIQVGNEITIAFRTFFLSDLSREGICQAILRPTLKTLPGHPARTAPYNQYGFEFAPGVVDYILGRLNALVPAGATLPVMQIICRGLYEQVRWQTAPRTITMELDPEGKAIKDRIESHVVDSLRLVLREQYGNSARTADAELKWLKVLRQLVREEGDGRVHTEVATRSSLKEKAAAAGIRGEIDPIINRLTDPKLLILRRVAVLSPGGSSEGELFCLGHDMVGIALLEALRVAKARQLTHGRIRKGVALFVALLSFAIVIGLVAVRRNGARSQQVSELLELSNQARAGNVLEAIAIARQAQALVDGTLATDERPKETLGALLSGLPVSVSFDNSDAALDAQAIYPTYALGKRTGFVNLMNNGLLDAYTVTGNTVQKQRFIAPEPLKAQNGKPAIAQLSVSDVSPGLFLVMYRPPAMTKAPGGVIAFSQALGPKHFGHEDLLKALGPAGRSINDLSLYGLSGDSIILYALSADQTSFHLRSLRVSNSLGLTPDINMEIKVPTPATQLNGHLLVSYFYKVTAPSEKSMPSISARPVPADEVIKVEARDVFPGSTPRTWEVSHLESVKKCKEKNADGQTCEVTAVPDLQQAGLLGLGLWESTRGRFGSYPRGYVSNLIVIDLGTQKPIEVDLRLAAEVKRTCSVASANRKTIIGERPLKRELTDDDLPTFMVKGDKGVLLGYASRTSAQLINVSTADMSCTEIFFPDAQIDAWRTSDDRTKLLAATRSGGLVWDISPSLDTTGDGVASRLAQACGGEFEKFIRREGEPAEETAKRVRLIKRICN